MDIAYTLQRMCLQPTTESCVHVMFLEYPVTSLLPNRPGVGLRMEPPKAALYREIPNLDKYFLEEQGLDFFVQFPVRHPNFAKSEGNCVSAVGAAIDQLTQSGGRSILEAVTVSDDNYSEGGFIFHLTTLWHDSREKEVRHFQLSESEWRDIICQDDSKPWTHLLQDLISRASDRAYIHVERQLQGTQYSPVDALKWNAYDILDANRLLALNMRQVRQQGTFLCLEPIRDFAVDDNRVRTVRLPCEHETTVCIAYLKTLSLAACIDMTCPSCDQIILPDRDIRHAILSAERCRRQRKALDETLWKHIEARKTERGTRVVTSGAIMCQALQHALQSMRVPESVSPRSVCPAWSVEAAAVLEKLRDAHGNSFEPFSTTLRDINSHLMQIVDSVVKECSGLRNADISDQIFPGWSSFVSRWMQRTLALMATPNYAGEDVWTASNEVPDDDICFDDEEKVLGGDVDIGTLLSEVSLM
jgi:hypothetical protein